MPAKVAFVRETIYSALFARAAAISWLIPSVNNALKFTTTSRKLRHWSNVQQEELPALFQTQRTEPVRREPNRPPIWMLNVEWFIYVPTLAQQDATIIPSTQENYILDALVKALEPDAGVLAGGGLDRCTLGGLVYDCKINGVVENFEGDLGDLGVLIVPVEITVPA